MFAKYNDPNILRVLLAVLLIGAVAAALGIARFAIATTITGALHANLGDVIAVFGYIGWYFALMYVFSEPGRGRLLTTVAPGLVLAPILYFTVLRFRYPETDQGFLFVGTFGAAVGYPSLGRMIYDRYVGGALDGYRTKLDALLFAALCMLFLVFTPNAMLDVATALHPATYDAHLYHFEATLGFQPSLVLGHWAKATPWIGSVLQWAYNVVPLTFAILYGAQIARPDRPSANLLAAFVVATLVALIGYHLLPVTGPKYLLDDFPNSVPPASDFPVAMTPLPPFPRNGVPSMHFGWALLLWLNARLLGNRWLLGFFSVLLALNVLATMALGEHYLIDLVAVIPVVVAVQALVIDSLPWSDPIRRRAIWGGFALWLGWVIALRYGIPLFEAVPGLSWLAIASTVAASAWLYLPLHRVFERNSPAPGERQAAAATLPAKRSVSPEVRVVATMFVMSGFAGLMYEVVFSKSLALTFGSTATAMYTVLATYMGGMAIGAWLGGRLAAARDHPLVLYAFCELGIGIYCAATGLIFSGIQNAYVHFASGVAPDAQILILIRVGLGIAGLLLPTVLMGMTLPILARFFEQRAYGLGRSVAVLYTANTLGAALGALLVAYAVIPALGIRGTTMGAVVLSLVVALLALRLHKRTLARPMGGGSVSQSPTGVAAGAMLPAATVAARNVGLIALAILGIGGVVTLATETIYIHLLAVVAGNSTYAFSLMLFTFLLGLGAGAEAGRRLLQTRQPLIGLLGWLEFGLAVVMLGGVFLWDIMPGYFASFAEFPLVRDFASRETVRGIVCWLAMFPPAAFIGAIYPIAMECIGHANPGRQIQSLGRAAALNTVGNLVGVLLGGFVLLPIFGALRTVQSLAVVCMALAAVALSISPQGKRWRAWAPAAVAVVLLAVQPASFNYDSLASGANVYFATQNFGKSVDHAESIDGGLTSVALAERPGEPSVRTLLTNGNFQGNDAQEGEMKAQLGSSLAPLLHTGGRESALVIGYGTGVSVRTLHEAGFRQVDVVDLSADIVRLANQYFSAVNAGVTRQPGVTTYITDGRNYLLLQDRKYDLVGIEISSIWFAGAASLYNREFYALVRQRLKPEGVLQQWVQLHHLAHEDVLRILGSARAEFRYVWMYLIGGQGILVASNDARASPAPNNIQQLRQAETLRPILEIFGKEPATLVDMQLLDPARTERLLNDFPVPAKYWISTDDNLFLEYSTPKGNAPDQARTTEENVQFIKLHSRESK